MLTMLDGNFHIEHFLVIYSEYRQDKGEFSDS